MNPIPTMDTTHESRCHTKDLQSLTLDVPAPAAILPRMTRLSAWTTESTCSDGTPGLESSEGQVCCPAGCGECGGPFCSTAALPSFGESDCCVITIMNSGVMCETTGESPCILEGKFHGAL